METEAKRLKKKELKVKGKKPVQLKSRQILTPEVILKNFKKQEAYFNRINTEAKRTLKK